MNKIWTIVIILGIVGSFTNIAYGDNELSPFAFPNPSNVTVGKQVTCDIGDPGFPSCDGRTSDEIWEESNKKAAAEMLPNCRSYVKNSEYLYLNPEVNSDYISCKDLIWKEDHNTNTSPWDHTPPN